MLVITYYFAGDGKAFESEADKKSYERTKKIDPYLKSITSIWQRINAPKKEIPRDKLTVFRGGYLAKGIYIGQDFFTEDEAKAYEQFANEAYLKWLDYLKFAMPEDLLTYYDEMYIKDLPSYGWTIWGEERPMPGTELVLLEKKGKGCTVSYDVFDGENFENAYHLDVIAWKVKTKDEPDTDPWVAYNKKRRHKAIELTVYKKLKKK